jgi:4-hydroxythreonine-4-phosphate dehydrogenase
MRSKIAVTMGDAGGIGPEVALKAAVTGSVARACTPLLVGDIRLLRRYARRMGIGHRLRNWQPPALPPQGEIGIIDVGRISGKAALGRPSKEAGLLAGKAIEEAVALACSHRVDGITTAPVSKASLAMAGYGMVGHTELLSRLSGARDHAMMILRGKLRVVFATTHLTLREVSRAITKAGLIKKFILTRDYLERYMGIREARIGVVCLNPHCGEEGMLGREEQRVIEPAIAEARRQGIGVEGPYPADSIYRPTCAGRFHAIVAMYHDQGMIPLKLRGHDDVVNITLGIPLVRTSPGHGTAFDIAGKFVASERSMVRAVLQCARIAKRMSHAG